MMSLLLLVHLYADDTILYTSGPSLDTVLTILQTSYNAIKLCFLCLQLFLNASKIKRMFFTCPPIQHHNSGRL